ncbi:MAG: 2-oxoacid:acceptor oxidoreductase family protein [Clostridium sp.]|nr:2-oxoacid:acceptor oxidoreductase family protein [Clostridium sp.]
MVSEEIIFAGFGGQGILSMAKFLAYAGMDSDMNVSWLPSYGPEMRGGTCNCSVIISEDLVGSPIITNPSTVIVMNRPSLEKFEPLLRKDGLLIMDSDLIDELPIREDINIVSIPAQSEAEKIGNKKIANMVLLGALVKKTKIVTIDAILSSLKDHGKESFFEVNKKAIEIGADYIK